jgi:signal transduction histidine kinase
MADGGGLTDVSSNGTTDSWALRLLQEGRSSTSELDRTVVFERLLEAAVSERTGWACELYDETLLGYAGLQELLMGALREGESDKTQAALQAAIVDIDRGMRKLRTILTTLRPAALDEIGLPAALESLIDRHRDRGSAQIESMLAIVRPADRAARLAPELENLVYRLVEEGLTNIEQHANAENVRVTVSESETKMDIRVSDDGSGFDRVLEPRLWIKESAGECGRSRRGAARRLRRAWHRTKSFPAARLAPVATAVCPVAR